MSGMETDLRAPLLGRRSGDSNSSGDSSVSIGADNNGAASGLVAGAGVGAGDVSVPMPNSLSLEPILEKIKTAIKNQNPKIYTFSAEDVGDEQTLPKMPCLLSKEPGAPGTIQEDKTMVLDLEELINFFKDKTTVRHMSALGLPGYTRADIHPAEDYWNLIKQTLNPEELAFFIKNHCEFTGTPEAYWADVQEKITQAKTVTAPTRPAGARRTRERLFNAAIIASQVGLSAYGAIQALIISGGMLSLETLKSTATYLAINATALSNITYQNTTYFFRPLCAATFLTYGQAGFNGTALSLLMNQNVTLGDTYFGAQGLAISNNKLVPRVPSFSYESESAGSTSVVSVTCIGVVLLPATVLTYKLFRKCARSYPSMKRLTQLSLGALAAYVAGPLTALVGACQNSLLTMGAMHACSSWAANSTDSGSMQWFSGLNVEAYRNNQQMINTSAEVFLGIGGVLAAAVVVATLLKSATARRQNGVFITAPLGGFGGVLPTPHY